MKVRPSHVPDFLTEPSLSQSSKCAIPYSARAPRECQTHYPITRFDTYVGVPLPTLSRAAFSLSPSLSHAPEPDLICIPNQEMYKIRKQHKFPYAQGFP
jgi:hypothetical protein